MIKYLKKDSILYSMKMNLIIGLYHRLTRVM